MTPTVQPLDATTWDVFAELVERNNGVFGGCWCIGFHPREETGQGHREAKHQRVLAGAAHAALAPVRQLAESIAQTQTAEVQTMLQLLTARGGAPLPAP